MKNIGLYLHVPPHVYWKFELSMRSINNKIPSPNPRDVHLSAIRYYRGAVGALVVFDISADKTFENLDKWLGELNEHADPNCCIMIVGNKTDLNHLRKVSTEEGRSLAGKHCSWACL